MAITALSERETPPLRVAPGASSGRRRGRGIAGIFITPLVLLVACGALYLYLRHQQLDDIERRSINRQVIGQRLLEHIELVAVSTVVVIAIAVPLGILLTRPALRRLSNPVLALANIGQAVPSIGVVVLLAITVGIGFRPALFALVLYALLPVLRNTMVGLDRVDRFLIDAGRGMGLARSTIVKPDNGSGRTVARTVVTDGPANARPRQRDSTMDIRQYVALSRSADSRPDPAADGAAGWALSLARVAHIKVDCPVSRRGCRSGSRPRRSQR